MKNLNILCPHFLKCSGCVFNKDVDQPDLLNEARIFFDNIGIANLDLHCGSPVAWRTRAKVAVRGTSQNPTIGLFEKGSHRTLDIPQCRVHHPAINQAISVVRTWMVKHEITPYDETTSCGLLRYLQLTVERNTSRVQLVLVWNEKLSSHHKKIIEALWLQQPQLWHSIWLNENTRKDNVIFSTSWQLLFGDLWLKETVRKQPLYLHPASFVQANMEMFEQLLNKIADNISPSKRVLDLYAGAGAIGVAISDQCHHVTCIETNPMAKECFEETLKHLPLNITERLSFVVAPSEKCLHLLKEENTQIVIVDPPRKGLDSSLLKAVNAAKNIQQLIYVSCGWTAFKRDCTALLAEGWLLKEADAFLFFPGSNHLEILAFFERKDS